MGLAVTEEQDLRIPVGDACTLSARIWTPDQAQHTPLPAILEILPYRKRDGTAARDATTHAVFAQSGYVSLRVDLRGTGQSDGLFDDEYSEQELSDVKTVIAWIAAQDWCNGSVGIMGISWGGFNGLQVAARRPEALKAVITCCSSVDRFADDIHFKGGCQLTENIGWAATAMSWFSMPPDPVLTGEDWRRIWLERLDATPFLAPQWIEHDTRDAYWKHGSVCEDFSAITAPVLAIGGWHDGYRNTPLKLLEGATSGPVKALIGPWNHKYPHLATPGPQIDFIAEALRWWDHWLKGKDTGVDTDPAYRAYLMDSIAPATRYTTRPGRWVALEQWPSPDIAPQTLTLGANTLGSTAMPAPLDIPQSALCGQCCGEYFPYDFGPGELPDDQQADDALSLCFDGAPLSAPFDLVGAPSLSLRLSSDAPVGQIVARLCDVAPDGASTLITFALLNLQFRDGFETAQPLTPGTPYDVTLVFDHAAYSLPEGHRLRLALAPSYWPFIWPEPEAATLSVQSGSLSLPELHNADALRVELPEPAQSAEPATRLIRSGVEAKTRSTDGDWHKITIKADHGEIENLDHGLRTRSALTENWEINTADSTQARARITWTRGLKRDEIDVSTHIETTLYRKTSGFYVSASLKAFDAQKCVFERKFRETITTKTFFADNK